MDRMFPTISKFPKVRGTYSIMRWEWLYEIYKRTMVLGLQRKILGVFFFPEDNLIMYGTILDLNRDGNLGAADNTWYIGV